MRQLFNQTLDGVVVKKVFSVEEVDEILNATKRIADSDKQYLPNGQVFPMPAAMIRNANEDLNRYVEKRDVLDTPLFQNVKNRIAGFFNMIGADFEISVPRIIVEGKNGTANFGNFRFLQPDMGGVFIHCGYLFRDDSPFYYDEVVEEMDKDGQLSFFMALQYPDEGGELTIYDMLWPDVSKKDGHENNEYVLNSSNEKIYAKDIRQFKIKPNPGDILVFRGGPIWHRVEPIFGNRPRITFGGFLNFSKDGKKLFYWA